MMHLKKSKVATPNAAVSGSFDDLLAEVRPYGAFKVRNIERGVTIGIHGD